MNTDIERLLDSIYLGDRACKGLYIDAWDQIVRLKVDCISRLRPGTQRWNFYTDEDIDDGWLVFDGVDQFNLQNDGYVPNDLINDIEIVATDGDKVVVEVSIEIGRAHV